MSRILGERVSFFPPASGDGPGSWANGCHFFHQPPEMEGPRPLFGPWLWANGCRFFHQPPEMGVQVALIRPGGVPLFGPTSGGLIHDPDNGDPSILGLKKKVAIPGI